MAIKVSGVYIVKNEEKNLGKSIESIRAVCDEIIVVDTGSQDGTVALAESLGARVEHFKWRDDFSAARNYAISHAKGEIIIFLDADEWFVRPLGPEAIAYIEEEMRQGYLAFFCPHMEYQGGKPDNLKYVLRIFKNYSGLKYINRIHEQLAVDMGKVVNVPKEQFTLYHSGYEAGVFASKISRNLEALERTIKTEHNPEKRAINFYYLSREHHLQKNVSQAWEYLNKFFSLYDRNPSFRKKHYVFAIAALHLRAGLAIANYPRVVTISECQRYVDEFIQDFPTHPVSQYHGATFQYGCVGNLAAAYAHITQAEELEAMYDPEQFPGDITTYSNCWSGHYFIKGDIEASTGNLTQALESLTKAIQTGVPQGWQSLFYILKDQPSTDVIVYIETIAPDLNEDQLLEVMAKLLFFPQLRQVYQYYALKHIKLTKSHSDMTAILALFEENPDFDHIIKVALAMLETDVQSANVLMCIAMMHTPDDSLYRQYCKHFNLEEIMPAFYANDVIPNLSSYGINLLHRASRFLLFFDNRSILNRMFKLMDNTMFARFYILSGYYNAGRQYEKTLASLDFPIERIAMPGERLACYIATGEAYAYLREYNKAVEALSAALEIAPRNLAARQGLNMIRGFSPQHAVLIDQILLMSSPPDANQVLH